MEDSFEKYQAVLKVFKIASSPNIEEIELDGVTSFMFNKQG
jgi:hypothetical protein